MTHADFKNKTGIIIIGTKTCEEDWLPILKKLEREFVRKEILTPRKSDLEIFDINFIDSLTQNGKDIVILIKEENLSGANFAILCNLCRKADCRDPFQWVRDQGKLPIFWLREITQNAR